MFEFILYVKSQALSADFYSRVLGLQPMLDVPGMTEFQLVEGCTLGLMPNAGIATIIGAVMPHPETGSGIPRCELYLHVDNPESCMATAIAAGATLVSDVCERNWGSRVGYVADPDGHVIAFANKS